jgi:hypothetical protein
VPRWYSAEGPGSNPGADAAVRGTARSGTPFNRPEAIRMSKLAGTFKAATGKDARAIFWIPMGLALVLVVTISSATIGLVKLFGFM